MQEAGDRWFDKLPKGQALVFLLLTRTPAEGWREAVRAWLTSSSHLLYTIYTDSVRIEDVREMAALTEGQPLPRAPHRVAQQNQVGLEKAANWAQKIVQTVAPAAPPKVKASPTRWRALESNQQGFHAVPDRFTTSTAGTEGYYLVGASNRGKTHAHNGTYREDATEVSATSHWNLIAVSDGAGTAPLARVGANLAVKHAVAAMRKAMPAQPGTSDIGVAIVEGLKAAVNAQQRFADDNHVPLTDLNATLLLLIHWALNKGCLMGLLHVGDGLIAAETVDGKYYVLTEADVDPDDSGRTLFLTSAPIKTWVARAKVYQFDEQLNIVALMTDGLAGDIEPPTPERLSSQLFEPLRQKVLCYPAHLRETALLHFLSYDRRGSYDDRTLALLARDLS
jgi:hypothetical protein